MKRAIILVLVVALLLGIGYIGLSPRSDTAEAAGPMTPTEYKLVTIVENEELVPGQPPLSSGWIDVKSYRKFKLYARLTPYEEEPSPFAPSVAVGIWDSPLGGDGPGYVSIPFEWQAHPPPPDLPPEAGFWGIGEEFNGLFSMINVSVLNLNPPESPTRTISLYLLMAKE